MSKHTPGPWRLITERHIGTLDGLGLAYAFKLDFEPETFEANARLIAAAPDLMEALQMILATWESGEHFSDKRNEIGRARAAIAKATGND